MENLLPQIEQHAYSVTRSAAETLNSLDDITGVLAALRENYSPIFSKLKVVPDTGKYAGQSLGVIRIQLDESGVTVWATCTEHNRPFRVTGKLEVTND